MEGLQDIAPCGFVRFDDSGHILLVNSTLLEILGYDAEGELVGAHIDRILPVASRIFYQTHFFPLLKLHDRVSEVYFSLKCRDGETIPALVNAARRTADDGDHVNDCVFIQMRQRSEYEDEILRAKRRSEQAVRAKDEFLAMVSHELRTPLSAIRGWSRMLARGFLGPEGASKAHEAIDRSSEALQKLIEDLLDFSRIISGKLRINVEPVDLTSIIGTTLDIVEPAAVAKDIHIETIVDGDAAAPVSGDVSRLQQVLWNLLSNAIKFTPKHGRVQLRVSRVDSSVELSLSDTGEGISADFLPFVFDRFRQAEAAATRSHGGLGLGLAITRHLVELHGGTIRAESPGPGQGATFTVRLPVLRGATNYSAEAASVAAAGGSDELAGLRIVVADDDVRAREMLVSVLERSGADVAAACSDGRDALAKVRQVRPDLLISDIEMPEADGHFLIRSIRALDDEISSIPAIALTAHTRRRDRVAALGAGYQMHIAKPVEPVELILAIANLTNRRFQRRSTE
ncbi:MAG: ATP-binding protein [Pyrinomonadaceae bacterium]